MRAAISMSVADKAKVSLQKPFPYVLLLCSLFIAFTDSDYCSHAYMIIAGLAEIFL
jgi:hypothetical protein